MSALRAPAPAAPRAAVPATGIEGPRRGRPPVRNEILAGGRLGRVDPEELAERFGTPFYAYDLDVITAQVAALRGALAPGIELAYAVKANPALAVVAHLAGLGLGTDIASAGELELVRRAGVDPDRIVMTGPGKRDEELRAAVAAGIRAITVESPRELRRLEAIAAAADIVVPILLRAAVPRAALLERVRLVGDDGAGKFGMDADDLLGAAREAVRSPHLDLLGIHAFGASNVASAASLVDHFEWTIELARGLAVATGFRLRLIDAGGGLGIAYDSDAPSLDLRVLATRTAALANRLAADPVTRSATLLLEPGRFFVAPAGAYVSRVVDRKVVEGNHVVILDGGVHHLLRPALVGQEHRLRILGGGNATGGASGGAADRTAKAFPVTVAGPLCSGLDVLAAQAVLPLPDVGRLVAVLDVGAYGYTESMPFFLSHPVPAEVAIKEGRAQLIRPRIEPRTWLDWQRNPAW
jgi:diaminopimelate decarboxylase